MLEVAVLLRTGQAGRRRLRGGYRAPGRRPLYLLGSSDFGARFRRRARVALRLRVAFRTGISRTCAATFRQNFKPSRTAKRAARDDRRRPFARRIRHGSATISASSQLEGPNLIRGHPTPLPPPVNSMEGHWNRGEQAAMPRTHALHQSRQARHGQPPGFGDPEETHGRRGDSDRADLRSPARLRSFRSRPEALRPFVRQQPPPNE